MSAPTREVPKFSSFRAKKSAPQEQHPSLSTTRKRQPSPEHDHGPVKSLRSAERHSASSQHNSKIRDLHRRVQDQHERHEGRSSATSRPSSLVHRDENSGLFAVDREGDQQNATYGRLHKYSIPSYHRVGFGNILGLPPRFKIDRAESTLDKVFITDKSATSKQVPQRLLLRRQRKQELPALLMPDEHDLDLAQDFVALSPSSADCDPESTDDAFGSFRHLDPTTNSDLHNIRQQGILDVAPAADLHIRQQNVQFVRATKSNPSDLQAWLDLAKHQEYLVSPGADAQSMTNVERRTLADMRIAVYEKALKHFPDSEASSREQLVMALLHEASLAWDTQKYIQKLRDILEQHSESFPIWTLYLNACQANFIDFRFEDVKTLFMRSLRTLGSSAKSSYQSETRKMILYLILRHTVFLLNTGYDELSIAIWQALCEYHMCKPEHLAGHNTSQVLSDFEQFWESERPRFGEVGARGWSANPQDINVASDVQSPLKDKLDPRLPFSSFSALETNTRKFFQFPGRTMDEIGADDPFHVVFFSDIREVLEVTATGLDRYDLLDAILCYLGLPSVSSSTDTGAQSQPQWRSDVFLRHGLLQMDFSHGADSIFDGQHVQSYQTTTELLFSNTFRGLSGPAEDHTHTQRPMHEAIHFARRILSSMVNHFPNDDDLAEYYLAFELSCFPREASKTAKHVLKQRPSSLRLYNACATIEANLGKVEKAAQIWSSTINMKNSFSHAAQEELVLLWRGWIWCDMEANQPQLALSHLSSFGGTVDSNGSDIIPISTATLLRLRNAFKDGFEHSLSQHRPHLAALNVEMLALVAYLTKPNALQASVDAVHEQCNAVQQRFANQHVLIEMLHQVKAGLIAYHIRQKRPYRPAFVRFELETSITRFPDNTIFLEMYRDNEARFRLDDRVRSILKNQVLTHGQSPFVTWTFAINQEVLRYTSQSSGSTAESVRSTFNRALMTVGSPVRYSQMLWTMWFRFEKQLAIEEVVRHSIGKSSIVEQSPFEKLKQVFLSGLHHLPWSKDWILLGLETFDRDDKMGWGFQDLKRLYDVLIERELRIRVDGLERLLSVRADDHY